MTDLHPDHPDLTPALRWMSNMLCYWALCTKPACLRARMCRGEPRRCIGRYTPIAPQDARFGLGAIMQRLDRGLSQDEISAAVTDAVAALEGWQARVLDSDARRRAMQRR